MAEATSHGGLLASEESLSAWQGPGASCENIRYGSNTAERICVSFFRAPLCLTPQDHLKSIYLLQQAKTINTNYQCRLKCLWCVSHRTLCQPLTLLSMYASVLCVSLDVFLCHARHSWVHAGSLLQYYRFALILFLESNLRLTSAPLVHLYLLICIPST